MQKTVSAALTNGFGNNIFQYVASRLLAEHHDTYHFVTPPWPDYYAIADLKQLNINFDARPMSSALSITDKSYKAAFDTLLSNQNLSLSGYFEDYTYYFPHRDRIKTWFPKVDSRKDNALVLHLRTGDRLVMKNEFYSKPTVENYLRAMEKFDFDELHIVTDMPVWRKSLPTPFQR